MGGHGEEHHEEPLAHLDDKKRCRLIVQFNVENAGQY